MRKGFVSLLALGMMFSLASCKIISESTFVKAGLDDFVEPEGLKKHVVSKDTIEFKGSKENFEVYAKEIYDYLVNKDFKYIGITNHKVLDSLFGAMPTYAFYLSTSFEEHKDESKDVYEFVAYNNVDEYNKSIDDVLIKLSYNESAENDYTIKVNIVYNLANFKLITEEEQKEEEEAKEEEEEENNNQEEDEDNKEELGD